MPAIKLQGKHVLVTGGSEGMGLAVAQQAAKEGARLTLMARTAAKLDAAKRQIESACSGSSVFTCTGDVTENEQVLAAIAAAEKHHGHIDILVCAAGWSHCGYFHEIPLAAFEAQMQLNYFGALYAVHALAPKMLARNSGHVVLFGSGTSFIGFIGYSAYCPTKMALRGLAEALRNEFQGTGVGVTLAAPPDVDTPGFQKENEQKPPETTKVTAGGVYKPEQVATRVWAAIKRGTFVPANPDLTVDALQTAQATLGPRSLLSTLWEMLLGLLKPLIFTFVTMEYDGVARKGAQARYAKLWAATAPGSGTSRQV